MVACLSVTHNSERFLLLLDCEAHAIFFQFFVLFWCPQETQVVTPLEADK